MKATGRQSAYPVEPLILHRWSSRAFSGEPLSREALAPLLEAARWAPSSGNLQPWRFVVIGRSSPRWAAWLDLLSPGNRGWASHAGALLVLVSRRLIPDKQTGAPRVSVSHSFDAGAAWVCLAQQAAANGLVAHAMGGFDRDGARLALALDDRYQVEVMIAVGHPAAPETLTDEQRAREVPNGRRPQSEWVFEEQFVPDPF